MKIARTVHDGIVRYGIVEGDRVRLFDGSPFALPDAIHVEDVPLSSVTLLAPVEPGAKIIGIGMNYPPSPDGPSYPLPEEPLLFIKTAGSTIGDGEVIELPPVPGEIVHEGELAVLLGKRVKQVRVEDALDAVFGYTIANDVTARDQMISDGQWTRAKNYDTFCPLGPLIETDLPADSAEIRTAVNGEPRRAGNTRDLLFGIPQLIAHLSNIFTLDPGDIILTGSPSGRGGIVPGDHVTVTIEGIGTLNNPVRARQ